MGTVMDFVALKIFGLKAVVSLVHMHHFLSKCAARFPLIL